MENPLAAPAATTTPDGPRPVSETISEILQRNASARFFHPYDDRMDPEYRPHHYSDLVKRVGRRYAGCTLVNYEIHEWEASGRPSQAGVHALLQRFCADLPARIATGGGLLLYGRPGTGKDHLMVAALYEAVFRHGFRVQWIDGLDFYREARRLVAEGGDDRKFIQNYAGPQILAISDPIPPKGDATQYATEMLQSVLDRRYRDQLSTWATLNVHGPSEASERLAGPIVDRLRHGSLCLRCEWDSWRAR